MRRLTFVLSCTLLALAAGAPAAKAAESRSAAIMDRFRNANEWRGHVMVVAHRGGWMEDGKIRLAENSLSSLRWAIGIGVEMVETDIQRTKDGAFVILHDPTLDRTTTCTGDVASKTLSELRDCKLVIEGSGQTTDEAVPTLQAFLEAAKGQVMVNLDSKLGIENLKAMTAMARDLGMADQIVSKAYVDTPDKLKAAREIVAAMGSDGQFMPLLDDAVSTDLDPLLRAATELKPEAMELRNTYTKGRPIREDGGLFFGAKARAIASRHDFHLWVNTLYSEDPHGLRSGGRGDEMAVLAGLPEDVYGFWAEQGATMIQTDEPKAAIAWLERNGYRIAYESLDESPDEPPASPGK